MKRLQPSSITSWFIWHLVAVVAIVLTVSQIRTGHSFVSLPGKETNFITLYALVYLVSMVVIGLVIVIRKGVKVVELIVISSAIFGGYFLSIIILESFYSRTILVVILLLSILSIALSFFIAAKLRIMIAAILTICTIGLQVQGNKPKEFLIDSFDLGPKPSMTRKFINTAMYSIESLRFEHYFDDCSLGESRCQEPMTGGGISTFGEGYLVATGEGKLHYFTFNNAKNKVNATMLPAQVPINEDVYTSAVGENARHTFRVTDILVREKATQFDLFVAHHFWKADEECGVMLISHVSGDIADFASGNKQFEWKTIFETTPCLKVTNGQLTRGGESGGRMGFIDDDTLMLTVGDYQRDGIYQQPMFAQDQKTSYGKTLLIDINTGTSSIFTRGHRNPQGLYIDREGGMWSTEHGPSGGDEINILEQDANYGWPLVTYGTQYGEHVWPWNKSQGRHEGFKQPLYTFLPSATLSNLIRLEGNAFPLWADDFLVGTFKKAVYHFRVNDGRVVFTEKLPIKGVTGRVRDLLEDRYGRVLMYLDDGSIIFLFPRDESAESAVSDKMRGAYVFSKCAGCHKIGDEATHGIGPDLLGIVGKDVASSSGYGYSKALSGLSGVWNKDRLDGFLADPMAFSPGTSMAISGMKNEADRAAVIQYLETWGN